MLKRWLVAVSLLVPVSARADAAAESQRASDRAAKGVASMLDALRDGLVEINSLRRVPHPPAAACLEPLEGLRARVRDAQEAHLDLQAALATSDPLQVAESLARVEHGRQRAEELRLRLHACVERVLREAPIVAWSDQQTSVVTPPCNVDVVWLPAWPPPPPMSAPRVLSAQ